MAFVPRAGAGRRGRTRSPRLPNPLPTGWEGPGLGVPREVMPCPVAKRDGNGPAPGLLPGTTARGRPARTAPPPPAPPGQPRRDPGGSGPPPGTPSPLTPARPRPESLRRGPGPPKPQFEPPPGDPPQPGGPRGSGCPPPPGPGDPAEGLGSKVRAVGGFGGYQPPPDLTRVMQELAPGRGWREPGWGPGHPAGAAGSPLGPRGIPGGAREPRRGHGMDGEPLTRPSPSCPAWPRDRRPPAPQPGPSRAPPAALASARCAGLCPTDNARHRASAPAPLHPLPPALPHSAPGRAAGPGAAGRCGTGQRGHREPPNASPQSPARSPRCSPGHGRMELGAGLLSHTVCAGRSPQPPHRQPAPSPWGLYIPRQPGRGWGPS
ncbi:basic salivary proline-rich protein 1-like [Molothrus aeneus]|uniref:basic salivary proline-rich protein 1-like n=1 Tax=Molothrus aeneus TaxID=84833 RepID=UPI00345961AE